ncbi:MAG TPA: hypothetical protein VGY90_01595 [Steroidobacteraceae bacterium]|jgi:hypothetical protein|nr:hypothetical protein [Steroidobacteraceae bacterium]
MAERLATFRGVVRCRRADTVPGLTLSGGTAEAPDEPTALAFSAVAPADLPGTLEDAVVDHLGGAHYRIGAQRREWLIASPAVHLHREIAAQFYRAIPPRPAPWAKRMFWRVVLALAASRAGLALLRALRR